MSQSRVAVCNTFVAATLGRYIAQKPAQRSANPRIRDNFATGSDKLTVAVPMRAGDAVIHLSRTLHGAGSTPATSRAAHIYSATP